MSTVYTARNLDYRVLVPQDAVAAVSADHQAAALLCMSDVLGAEEETHMAIGGGTDKFVVYVTFDNEIFHDLIDPSQSDSGEALVVGGQEGIYPAKMCVDLEMTLRAAKAFAEAGSMDQSLFWERDGVVEIV
jgi:Immunity protein Imm1/Isochorismatase family